MKNSQFLISTLRHQYTLNNDGGGNDGWCRVNNYYLLEMLRIAEATEQQHAELLAALVEIRDSNGWIGNEHKYMKLLASEAIAKVSRQ